MNLSTKWAEAILNKDFFKIVTFSKGMIGYAEPSAEPNYLAPDVENAELGAVVRKALAASKRIGFSEFQKLFASGEMQALANYREMAAMEKYGYKTKRAMYKNMLICSIEATEDVIEINPTHHKGGGSYTVTKDMNLEPVCVSVAVSDAELGAALRDGFKRCT